MSNPATPAGGISCLVADDHPAVVEAVSDVLAAAGVRVVARARDGEEALALIGSAAPQVALLDLRMPRLSGIEVARALGRTGEAGTAVILYTAFGDRALLTEALDAGARGFVLKEAPLAEVVRAVELVSAGRTYVDPVLAGVISSSAATGKIVTLTQRERDVLRLLADGLDTAEIASSLAYSERTIKNIIHDVTTRLNLRNRSHAVAYAIKAGIV